MASGTRKCNNENSYSFPVSLAIIKLNIVPKIMIIIPQILIAFAVVLSVDKWLILLSSFGNVDSIFAPQEKHLPEDFSSVINFDLQFGQISIYNTSNIIEYIIPNIPIKYNA